MPKISSNALFHFTNWDSLLGILENGFHPRFSLEYITFKNNDTFGYAIPIISFCDIPLSQIKLHVYRYGSYGIGLKKEWGISKGINPVLYVEKDSNLSNDIYDFTMNILKKYREEVGAIAERYKKTNDKILEFEKILNKDEVIKNMLNECKKELDTLDKLYDRANLRVKHIVNIIKYLKSYEGHSLGNHESLDEKIRFYDEREWRYIPDLKTCDNDLIKLDITYGLMKKEMFYNSDTLNEANSLLKMDNLSFQPDDIKYIIIKEESEILEMIRKLDQIKGDKYPSNTIKILTSRILTYDQINDDF
ncbi:MAG TPA: abortive infection system antitoxin AbiGi family protein [Smithellaceae bacterium]|nr:abortive infection system antitoxin AbiGi family protein [Smithellaceae bacterium]